MRDPVAPFAGDTDIDAKPIAGGAAGFEGVIVRAHGLALGLEHPASAECAVERGKVLRCGDPTAGCPFMVQIAAQAPIAGGRRAAEPAASMSVGKACEVATAKRLGLSQAERRNNAALSEVVEGLARRRLDDQADQDVVGVGIGKMAAQRSLGIVTRDETDRVVRCEAAVTACQAGEEEVDIFQIVGYARRVIEQMAQRHPVMIGQAGPPIVFGQPCCHRGVEVEHTVLRELDGDEQKAKTDNHDILQNLKSEIADIGTKLDKLLSAYLDEIVSAEEYAAQKEKLLARKVEYTEEITGIENGSVSWLEPARAFVKSLNHAAELVRSGDKAEMTTFLKQIGSNHILIDKSFSFSPKKPFQILCERRVSRRELTSSNLHFPNWRRGRDSNPRGM